eukprot:gene6081-42_t
MAQTKVHGCKDQPQHVSTERLMAQGYLAGCYKADGKEVIHVLPRRYKQLLLDVSALETAAKKAFEGLSDFDCFDTDLFGYMEPCARKFLTPHQGVPFNSQVLKNVGTNMFGVVPQFNNLEQRGPKSETNIPFTQIIQSAISLLEQDEKRTLTLIVPSTTHFVRAGTLLRTEQRIWKERALPFLRAAGVLTGELYVQGWDVLPHGDIKKQHPQVTDKTWIALFLKGPRERVTPEHRRSVEEKLFEIPAAMERPAGIPNLIRIATTPKTTVVIEAGGPTWKDGKADTMWSMIVEEIPEGAGLEPYYG